MPGKPLPARSPVVPTIGGQQAAQDRAIEQLDRRLNRGGPAELLVHVSPDPPPHKRGRLWFDTDEPTS